MNHITESQPAANARPRRKNPAWIALSGAILAVPLVLAFSFPLYNRQTPTLIGIPFFYWFQLLMPVLVTVATWIVYQLLFTGDGADEDGEKVEA